jgi:hypothetical protein
VVHLRPHEIDLSPEPQGSIGAALVSSIFTVGPMVRIELEREGGEDGLVEVELTRERYLQSPLTLGTRVFIKPRNLFVGT